MQIRVAVTFAVCAMLYASAAVSLGLRLTNGCSAPSAKSAAAEKLTIAIRSETEPNKNARCFFVAFMLLNLARGATLREPLTVLIFNDHRRALN